MADEILKPTAPGIESLPGAEAPAPGATLPSAIPAGFEQIPGALYPTAASQQLAYSDIRPVGEVGASGSFLIGKPTSPSIQLPGGPVTVDLSTGATAPGGTTLSGGAAPDLPTLKETAAAGTSADAITSLIDEFERKNAAIQAEILKSSTTSEREDVLQKQIDELTAQFKKGLLNIEGRPIPLEDIGGEQERLVKNTAAILAPLETALGREEKKRTGVLGRLTTALGFQRDTQALQLERAKLLQKPITEAATAVRDYVIDLAKKYPDAGIALTDSAESAAKKVAGSKIYQGEVASKEATTDDIREYQFAKQQGFKGSFLQFVDRKKAGTGTGDIGGITFPGGPSAPTAPERSFEEFLAAEEQKAGQTFGPKKREELRKQFEASQEKPSDVETKKQKWLSNPQVNPTIKQLIRGDASVSKLTDAEQKRLGSQLEQAQAEGVIPPLSKEEFRQESKTIKNTARQDENIKGFGDVRSSYETARSNAAKGNGAGDVVLMRMIAKITDPTTGVREEEFRTFAGAQSKLAEIGINLTKRMWSGDRLTNEGRSELLKVAQERYDQSERAYSEAYDYYLNQIEDAGGTDKDFIPRVVAPKEAAKQSVGGADISDLNFKL